MSSLILRGWNWCRRFRKRCGYGVHSPSDFFLITFVIYENLPFYAYERLERCRKMYGAKPEHREKVDKLLFRLVNYLQPESMLEIGTGTGISTMYMAEAKRKMSVTTFSDYGGSTDTTISIANCLKDCGCRDDIVFREGDMADIGRFINASESKPDIIHISNTDNYREALETVIPYVSSDTCIIVSRPYADKEKKKWWKSVVEDKRTYVTFDLYDIGLLFFDSKRVKEHRVVNFL